MSAVSFVKMEGAGNDYVYVDTIRQPFPGARAGELARCWSDRHFGIGGDGLVLLGPSSRAAVRMSMWNADGSRGAICGNGLRCIAKLAHDHGHAPGPVFTVETDVGEREVALQLEGGVVVAASAAVGAVRTTPTPRAVTVRSRTVRFHAADAGNPHAVVFLDQDPETYPVTEIGAALQAAAGVAGGVNVEFVQVRADGSLAQRTYERGSGETLACGSGAAAAAATALDLGLVPGPEVLVRLRGGVLEVRRTGRGLVIGGPVRTVFTGVVELPAGQ